jgi:hypothetical protein
LDCIQKPLALFFRESSLELRDQSRQGSRLFIRCEVTAGQPLDLEAELAQSFLREADLPVFKGIFVAAAHQERELFAISLEEVTEVEPIALRFVISHEALPRRGRTGHRGGPWRYGARGPRRPLRDSLWPHLPYSWHPLEQREGAA